MCSGNKLTSLLVQTCPDLKYLNCCQNNITSANMDYLMCSLPERKAADKATIIPVYSSDHTAAVTDFKKCNSNNAKAKNWSVIYYWGTEIPATNGTFRCSDAAMDMNQCIKFTANGAITLRLSGTSDNTLFKIVCGKTDTLIKARSVTKTFSGLKPTDTAYLYGNVNLLRVSSITSGKDTGSVRYLDVNGNNVLQSLYIEGGVHVLKLDKCTSLNTIHCQNSRLSALDVSTIFALQYLVCDSNARLKSLVVNSTVLKQMSCVNNQLTSLDVSGCTALEQLACSRNLLKFLSVGSGMKKLDCSQNYLTSLYVSQCPKLVVLGCSQNSFGTEAWDALICSLPTVGSGATGVFYPLTAQENGEAFKAANAKNARNKGWKVCYKVAVDSGAIADTIATFGEHVCGTNPASVSEFAEESGLHVWPNPARTELHIADAAGKVTVCDLTGRVVWRAEATGAEELQINIAGWAKGMYFVRAGRSTVKFVKE
jgi:hypothetical protein